MRTYYEVYVSFKLVRGKSYLVNLSLHSTSLYFPFLVSSPSSLLSHSRFFHSVKEAQGYISYLYKRFPTTTAPYPVLDALQPSLF